MKIMERKQCDILVAGGGVAGVAAAVQAARCGKKVILVEKTVQLGGLATTGLVNMFEPMDNGRGVQIIKGMADEFLRTSIRYGWDNMPAEWVNGEPGYGKTNRRLVCRFSAPIFALTLCELVTEHGIDVMFDTVVTDVESEPGKIHSAYVFNKSGYSQITAGVYIDTTGDADVLHYAGVPTVTGGNYHTYAGWSLSLENCKKAVEAQDVGKLYFDIPGGNATMYGKNHPEGMPLWDGTNGQQVSEYLKTNQLALLNNIKGDDRKSRDIVMLPGMCQFRTTRHIDGEYTFTGEEYYIHREDSICAVNDCHHRDRIFEIPYGTLMRKDWHNVLTAGRCASAQGHGWNTLRVIPQAILTGQAAGMAASMALDCGCSVSQVDIAKLQEGLEAAGVMIHFDDAWVPVENQ